jgi:hypothetical protein
MVARGRGGVGVSPERFLRPPTPRLPPRARADAGRVFARALALRGLGHVECRAGLWDHVAGGWAWFLGRARCGLKEAGRHRHEER